MDKFEHWDQISVLQQNALELPAQPELTAAAYTTTSELVQAQRLPKAISQSIMPSNASRTNALMQSFFQRKKTASPDVEPLTLEKIRQSVAQAVEKYQKWFFNKQSHRGREGLFTWLRHGQAGQDRAKRLLDNVTRSTIETPDDALSYIKNLLTADKTKYHRHSFASFLMDELSQLVHLKPLDTYDRASVRATYQN